MKIFQINTYSSGSTGSLMAGIHSYLLENSYDSYLAWGRGRKESNAREMKFSSQPEVYFHAGMSRVFGRAGFMGSKLATERLINRIQEINPDIIHLHNVHGYVLNLPILFHYLRESGKPIVWTLHDCWSFTGHCGYFTEAKCNQWLDHCGQLECPQMKTIVPSYFIDTSYKEFEDKIKLYMDMPNLQLVTPSHWLAGLLCNSFMAGHPVSVIPNGIDTSCWHHTENNIRQSLGIAPDQIMLLGVASPWDERKGLRDFIQLSQILDNKRYRVVLIGLTRKDLKKLPKTIIGIAKTESRDQLVEYYSASDLFVNPTHDDNYPTVNLEALACGTRVITYRTGGSPECSANRDECIVVNEQNPLALASEIKRVSLRAFNATSIRQTISQDRCSLAYLHLYESLAHAK